MSEMYWDPMAPVPEDLDYYAEHFDPYDVNLTRGRFNRISSELREKSPIFHSDAHEADTGGFWVVTRYRDIKAIHDDPATYSSFPVTVPPFGNIRPMIPLESDPPLQKKYRAIVNPYFSSRNLHAREEQYRMRVTELIDAFIERGECDLAKELCVPHPLNGIMDALGVPDEDRPKMESISNRLLRKPGIGEDPTEAAKVVRDAAIELYTYFTEAIEARRKEPGDDVISVLAHAEVDGTPLTMNELLDFCMILVPAGYETVASTLGYSFAFLADRPEIADKLRSQPGLVPHAIEEAMRYLSPVRGLSRTVMVDHELSGHKFRRGDRINVNWTAANWDPEEFPDPERFVPDRSPNRQMSFGWGAHLCLGIHMARTEMKVAWEEVLRRLKSFWITDPSKVMELPGTTWGIMSLPVGFEAADG